MNTLVHGTQSTWHTESRWEFGDVIYDLKLSSQDNGT